MRYEKVKKTFRDYEMYCSSRDSNEKRVNLLQEKTLFNPPFSAC